MKIFPRYNPRLSVKWATIGIYNKHLAATSLLSWTDLLNNILKSDITAQTLPGRPHITHREVECPHLFPIISLSGHFDAVEQKARGWLLSRVILPATI